MVAGFYKHGVIFILLSFLPSCVHSLLRRSWALNQHRLLPTSSGEVPWRARLLPLRSDISDDIISKDLSSDDVSYVKVAPHVFPTGFPHDAKAFTTSTSSPPTPDDRFASIFRQSAPYIAMHRGSTMVIHIPGSVLRCKKVFDGVMDDIAILHLLGVKLVLIIGVRSQIDERIIASGDVPRYHGGMRITDEVMLRYLKEEAGSARYEIESALTRGFRGKGGINVVSGNLFYSAKPLGVRDGIDFRLTGEVRKVEVDNFMRRLDSGDVVLLTSLGYSSSGEVYNVPSESLAADTAARLKAAKLLFLTEGEGLVDTRSDKPVLSLRLSQAAKLLLDWGIDPRLYNTLDLHQSEAPTPSPWAFTNDTSTDGLMQPNQGPIYRYLPSTVHHGESSGLESVPAYMRMLARGVYSLMGGVRRAHFVPAHSGALLQELYTTDGSGMLICRDLYEGIRPALETDLHTLQDMLRPLEEEGILVRRSPEELLKDIPNIFLMVRDNVTIACGMLKQYSETHAEIACLAVHPSYRRSGRGETMLTYLEHRAVLQNITTVFVLSTRTMQWFEERGFCSADPSCLPPNRKYNAARNSKVYIKRLGSQRDLEAENLLWDIA